MSRIAIQLRYETSHSRAQDSRTATQIARLRSMLTFTDLSLNQARYRMSIVEDLLRREPSPKLREQYNVIHGDVLLLDHIAKLQSQMTNKAVTGHYIPERR